MPRILSFRQYIVCFLPCRNEESPKEVQFLWADVHKPLCLQSPQDEDACETVLSLVQSWGRPALSADGPHPPPPPPRKCEHDGWGPLQVGGCACGEATVPHAGEVFALHTRGSRDATDIYPDPQSGQYKLPADRAKASTDFHPCAAATSCALRELYVSELSAAARKEEDAGKTRDCSCGPLSCQSGKARCG